MKFIPGHFLFGQTIAAIATAPGEAAISIIRISGRQAVDAVDQIFTGKVSSYSSHTLHFGKIIASDGSVIDHTLLLVMLAPRSFTGEDIIEIHCHGGSLITQKVFERVLETGVRAAGAGEFSLKAFLNKKIDLTQAEAIQSLISAQNESALKVAERQLEGNLQKEILSLQKDATNITAILEAWVDFPEEDLGFASFQQVRDKLESIIERIRKLIHTFHEGKIISDGLSLCLVGTPNVGKSSIMNALLGTERAIVTDTPGTTRDFLEEILLLGKLHFRLIDTAGMREAEEIVEKEGIKRSRKAMKDADLILLVLDASRSLNEYDRKLLNERDPEKTIVLWNKIDLALPSEKIKAQAVVSISAKTQRGFTDLKQAVHEWVFQGKSSSQEQVVLTRQRHKEALEKSLMHAEKVKESLSKEISAEFISSDMRCMLKELAQIIGTDVQEDLLSSIFSQFCVGK